MVKIIINEFLYSLIFGYSIEESLRRANTVLEVKYFKGEYNHDFVTSNLKSITLTLKDGTSRTTEIN